MRTYGVLTLVAALALVLAGRSIQPHAVASSHREAPMISRDPVADTTDVYVFVSPDQPDTVTLIGAWVPLAEPAGGPNYYDFGDDVLYEIYIDNDGDAREDISYQFQFETRVTNPNTFLYNTGPITSLEDADWNVRQFYTVTRVDRNGEQVLGRNLQVAPWNVGPKSTPNYDELAAMAGYDIGSPGLRVFAGPRDDPFFVDLGATFDLLTIRALPGTRGGGVDNLAGYNVQAIALQVPVASLTRNGQRPLLANDPAAVIGVWATSSRRATTVLNPATATETSSGPWVQVSRLGHPLVNEVVIPLGQKDRWNFSEPREDGQFLTYVTDPEAARLLNLLHNISVPPTPRNDLVAVFLTGVPGLTQPPNVTPSEQLRLNVAVPPSATTNRLGVLAGDNAGYPNGRRLRDDVVDIALRAVAGVLVEGFNVSPNNALGDGVDENDLQFLPYFPYLASPHQGFEHLEFRQEPLR